MSPQCTRFVDGRFFLNDSGLTVAPKNGSLDQQFLDYQILSLNDVIYSLGKGSAQKNLDVPAFRLLPVYVPRLSEQRRIVAILENAFESIATAKADVVTNIANARELLETIREKLFAPTAEWISAHLSDIIDIKHGFAFKSRHFRSSGDQVLLTPGNFYETGGYRIRGNRQKYYVGDVPDGYVLEAGALLVAMTEQAPGLLGSPAIVPESGTYLHNQRLGLVSIKDSVQCTIGFLFHLFNTRRVRREIYESASGVKVRHTSPSKIGQISVSLPPIMVEQTLIDSRMNEVERSVYRLQEIYRAKYIALDSLKRYFLSAAFSGEL